jgi:hypothetical protein
MKETSEVSSNGNPQSSVSMEETPKGHGWKPTMVMDMISLKYTYIKQGYYCFFSTKEHHGHGHNFFEIYIHKTRVLLLFFNQRGVSERS